MNNEDYEFQETLMSLGEYRTTATVLAYMRNHYIAKSSQIEHATGLRQPEVSTAMKELKERGWIECNNIKTPRKGRPSNVYTLSASTDKIIDWYLSQELDKSTRRQQMINKLKELIK